MKKEIKDFDYFDIVTFDNDNGRKDTGIIILTLNKYSVGNRYCVSTHVGDLFVEKEELKSVRVLLMEHYQSRLSRRIRRRARDMGMNKKLKRGYHL